MFNCQEVFYDLGLCLEHEFDVEMDKRRRDMERNTEPWWRSHYDENGEVGVQASTKDEEVGLLDSIKITFLGDKNRA